MMFLKEFIANANAVVFPFIFRKFKFCAFSCDSGHEHPWPLFMCFPVLKARSVYWSATALRSPGKPQAVTSLVTVTPQDRMLPAPGKGQQKGKCTLALRLLSSDKTTAEDRSVLDVAGRDLVGQGTHVSPAASCPGELLCCS